MLKENEIHELVEYRNAIKMHVFFIHWFYTSSKSLSSKTKPMTKVNSLQISFYSKFNFYFIYLEYWKIKIKN